jgi:hypothetical protein
VTFYVAFSSGQRMRKLIPRWMNTMGEIMRIAVVRWLIRLTPTELQVIGSLALSGASASPESKARSQPERISDE